MAERKNKLTKAKAEPAVENVIESVSVKKTYEKDDMIPCRSVTVGELILQSPHDKLDMYRWYGIGDVLDVSYQDLKSLKSHRSGFIYNPQFLIEDDDLVEEWGLTEIYGAFYGFDDPDRFFSTKASKLKEKLQDAPKGLQEAIKATASQYIKDGRLDSLQTIRVIDEVLGTELMSFVK